MKLYAIGLGPGDFSYLAPKASEALRQSDVIVGYTEYVKSIPDLITGKQIISTGMTGEVERCEAAVREALGGKKVCVVSSGDPGIYGMAALLFELASMHSELEVEVIPGITAASAAAAILGSPLTNDFAVISLSDLLTPWEVIEKRFEAAAMGDFVICLYNPQSKTRSDYLKRACDITLRHKPPETMCGYVKNALRGYDSESRVCTLAQLRETQVDMLTTVIIGNASTRVVNGRLVTIRGYGL